MGLFSKKLSDEELIQQNIAAQQAEATDVNTKKDEDGLGDSKLAMEVSKLKAQMEGMGEQRKATNDRFSRISEQMGELRGMIVETNKAVTRIEAATTRAIDMVESVKPDQLMVEVRKQDSKSEALKANIESNEMMMADLMKEMKEMRKKIDFYKGVEQIAQMNDEIKKELIDMKKLESTIDRHSNKVESIFLDVEKRYTELDKFQDITKDLKKSFEKIQGDVDKLRVRIENSADKKEVVKILGKFNDFEKHTTNLLNLLDEKTKNTTEKIENDTKKMEKHIDTKINKGLKKLNIEIDEPTKENKEENKKTENIDKTKSQENKKTNPFSKFSQIFKKKQKNQENTTENTQKEESNKEKDEEKTENQEVIENQEKISENQEENTSEDTSFENLSKEPEKKEEQKQ
ncbi:hypothetical protein K9M18_00180 [Candidatus Woesearchaeota archaeon]|nr:hypothetical protein [Candidatus Woesearchaeota archaeon]